MNSDLILGLGGLGGLALFQRFRPEAASSAVQASEDVVALVRSELGTMQSQVTDLRTEVETLRAQLGVEIEKRIAAERRAAQAETRLAVEVELHQDTERRLAEAIVERDEALAELTTARCAIEEHERVFRERGGRRASDATPPRQ